MPGAVRIGDANSAGGSATGNGARTVLINGKPACTTASPVTAHAPCPRVKIHCNAKTGSGTKTVLAENKGINWIGESDTCGHSRAQGSRDVIIPAG